ncbi:hypothetical protein ACIRRA_19125 [Nocardia sp. NPDC101769]|uniref:hypothetical protein n=1 Tax=Nocardia sp. NPDC101769 TaxID=3364333 RepID=UPI0038149FA8
MSDMPDHPNIELAVRYHRAVAAGATGTGLAAYFHPDVVQRELPNALVPQGATRNLGEIPAAAERGRQVIRRLPHHPGRIDRRATRLRLLVTKF